MELPLIEEDRHSKQTQIRSLQVGLSEASPAGDAREEDFPLLRNKRPQPLAAHRGNRFLSWRAGRGGSLGAASLDGSDSAALRSPARRWLGRLYL